jgi:Flp pilus assembly protein TadB
MRLTRPVYESLPFLYMAIGGVAILVFYLDPEGLRAVVAFLIGLIAETAALTLLLRRQDYRSLSREYSGETIDFPSTLHS